MCRPQNPLLYRAGTPTKPVVVERLIGSPVPPQTGSRHPSLEQDLVLKSLWLSKSREKNMSKLRRKWKHLFTYTESICTSRRTDPRHAVAVITPVVRSFLQPCNHLCYTLKTTDEAPPNLFYSCGHVPITADELTLLKPFVWAANWKHFFFIHKKVWKIMIKKQCKVNKVHKAAQTFCSPVTRPVCFMSCCLVWVFSHYC